MRASIRWSWVAGVLVLGCGDRGGGADGADTGAEGSTGTSDSGNETGSGTGSTTADETSTGNTKFDIGYETSTTGDFDPCKVHDDQDGVTPCDQQAPPDSFDPEVQWVWGDNPQGSSSGPPMVANLTDDNNDGEVDLCDTPDVVLSAYPGQIIVMDGMTGSIHWTSAMPLKQYAVPAVGDIDNDGLVEVIMRNGSGNMVAFENDGTHKWTSAGSLNNGLVAAPALADIDNDGDVEIVSGDAVTDHEGNLLWKAPNGYVGWSASAIHDLDDDDDMEILVGGFAYHHDGTPYFSTNVVGLGTGVYSQIADLDDDGLPEILMAGTGGATLLEHDGTVKWGPWGGGSGDENRPMNIHDFDGDDEPEFGASALNGTFAYGVYETTPAVTWTGGAVDSSGQSGGTAFDFLGLGVAQAIYADETTMYVYDEQGNVLMSTPRSSLTQIEYPVVADVDNDGSAEILVVSNPYPQQTAPGLQVIKDKEDRWIQARRIWNQHTYHVTNVREDGTIPQVEPKNWKQLNTYRTQAQIAEGGGVCEPEG